MFLTRDRPEDVEMQREIRESSIQSLRIMDGAYLEPQYKDALTILQIFLQWDIPSYWRTAPEEEKARYTPGSIDRRLEATPDQAQRLDILDNAIIHYAHLLERNPPSLRTHLLSPKPLFKPTTPLQYDLFYHRM
ncbi:MAG TPA: hypothetical protein VJB12_00300 [Candidatus Nanoarchaeia archaeon]|nr:hypothetical protein [Candidatus Nanoarchaeia archaeon]